MDMPAQSPVDRYFASIGAALDGLDIFLRDDLVAALQARPGRPGRDRICRPAGDVVRLLAASSRLTRSRFAFRAPKAAFPFSRTCWNWKTTAGGPKTRLAEIPEADTLREEMADFILRHKAFPKRSAAHHGRAALSGIGAGGARVLAAGAARDGEGLGQSEDHAALLSRPLGRLRRHRQPADGLHRHDRGFLAGYRQDAGDAGRQAQRRRWTSRCRSAGCSIRSWRANSTPSRSAIRPIRCRRRRSPPISTRISRICIPSSCAASCSGRSIRPASPSTTTRVNDILTRCQAGKCLAADLDDAGHLFEGGEAGAQRAVVVGTGARRIPHRDRRSGSGAHGRLRLRETRAGPARGLSGALCRGRNAERSSRATRSTSFPAGR